MPHFSENFSIFLVTELKGMALWSGKFVMSSMQMQEKPQREENKTYLKLKKYVSYGFPFEGTEAICHIHRETYNDIAERPLISDRNKWKYEYLHVKQLRYFI